MTQNKPKVSIVVPVYNVENYLEQCLDSLVSQTFLDIEIIAVNDNSPDNSLEILESFKNKDKRVVVLNHQQNGGLRASVYTGLEAVKSEYVTFVDSDDWVKLDFVETLYQAIVQNDVDCVSTGFIECFKDSIKEMPLKKGGFFNQEQLEKKVLEPFFENGIELNETINNNRCGKIYKTDLLKQATVGSNKKLSMREDLELNLRFFSICSSALLLDSYVGYCYRRDREQSITNSFNKTRISQNDLLIKELRKLANEQSRTGRFVDEMHMHYYKFYQISECLSSDISSEGKLEYIDLVLEGHDEQELALYSLYEIEVYLNAKLEDADKLRLLIKATERIDNSISIENKDNYYCSFIIKILKSSLPINQRIQQAKRLKSKLSNKRYLLEFAKEQSFMGKISCLLVYFGLERLFVTLNEIKRK